MGDGHRGTESTGLPASENGISASLKIPNWPEVGVHYQLVEAEDVKTSHLTLDTKKAEYVKAFSQYTSSARLSPEAGNLPGVAQSQDVVFRNIFGMGDVSTGAEGTKPALEENKKPFASLNTGALLQQRNELYRSLHYEDVQCVADALSERAK